VPHGERVAPSVAVARMLDSHQLTRVRSCSTSAWHIAGAPYPVMPAAPGGREHCNPALQCPRPTRDLKRHCETGVTSGLLRQIGNYKKDPEHV
jgi:hypothetical protein